MKAAELAAIAAPLMTSMTQKAIRTEALTTLGAIRSAEKAYYAEHGYYVFPCREKFYGKKLNNKTVFVGVSGGVDSSVSAALLKGQGYNVVGVFIRTWQPDFIECTWQSERRDAMRVCAHLDIPFLECDGEEAYKKYLNLKEDLAKEKDPIKKKELLLETVKLGDTYNF